MEVRKMNILKYLDFLRSPTNGSELSVDENGLFDKQGNRFDIKDDIPRFVEKINYADSFGYQWNIFDKVQLDRFSSHDLTSKRFYKNTRWDDASLKGKNLLEVGSGAGRFTEVLLKTGVNLFTIDYSNAVEANWKNNKQNKEFFIAQADIYNLPFRKNSFDYVFCFGVLQHTPDPKLSFLKLVEFIQPGGQISVDVYLKNWKSLFVTKYWVRPITKRMDKEKLLKFVQWYVPKWFPLSTNLLKVPYVGKFLAQIIPILNYSDHFPELSKKELIDWAILDTFDMLSPAYDKPQTLKTLREWAVTSNLEIIYCGRGDNGYVLVAKKPNH